MVVCQASKIHLPTPFASPSSSKTPTSLLFEPHSFSLALSHSDSSLSLFPSISFPFSSTQKSLSIPPPSSSSTFLLLKTQKSPNPRVLFVVAGPYKGGSKVLLRFFLYRNDGSKAFEKAKVVSKQNGIEFDDKVGVLIDVSHGLKLMISGSVNFFALYSVSSSKVLIFGVNLVVDTDESDDGVAFKLMKFAVIDCLKPVFSISISFEWLVLGEENGVKVWNLRELVKGKKVKKVKNYGLSNGVIGDNNGVSNGGSSTSEIVSNGHLDGKIEKPSVSVKPRSGKHRQESAEPGACFVPFEPKEVKDLTSGKASSMSLKAISIRPLSSKRFLVLDTVGDLFVLHVTDTSVGSDVTCYMRLLPHVMKVQMMAVFPDISSRRQTVWISDGHHSMHVVDISSAVNETDKREIVQAIFTSEKVQDMIPTAANSILILGQGSLYAYTIS
ncbi:hypothetical protein ERO13_A11G162300v2 [Gossypium hirsutum]|uniref:Uncharacterized protein isoform X1 n=2 Tax=Gossypium TaxID=3633 RepID=A0A1U8I800_GOSHI|nr:uncharacterized protein LOC107893762 isoform X1 [Gossypium hirsutum]XP_016674336.2 uncharacterized protein LOC107893762 isoform X1 [Gossypium hirsutum]XP_016674337.2 uncharacterized protein LOC107893762 isoform X1 [Gossypium hirsutum]XP_016674338.2 uncharacterized protein LOC107893762 isoform X1 [Gossypium hirsutum]KAB2057494.1 hypothetical protein ES319_A11G172800v1 [Gossypium barbadense]KAB2057495.1 hypothetical protein ES319_A11G172800v1 [Gossypium barbadense]KAG4175079.1 hypothetical p